MLVNIPIQDSMKEFALTSKSTLKYSKDCMLHFENESKGFILNATMVPIYKLKLDDNVHKDSFIKSRTMSKMIMMVGHNIPLSTSS